MEKRDQHHEIGIEDYFIIAAFATDNRARALATSEAIQLAGSALFAPFASFDGHDFYPDLFDKAAVLVSRLARNHPLSNGNKRAAYATLDVFLARNGYHLIPDLPDAALMPKVAAGTVSEDDLADWIRKNVELA